MAAMPAPGDRARGLRHWAGLQPSAGRSASGGAGHQQDLGQEAMQGIVELRQEGGEEDHHLRIHDDDPQTLSNQVDIASRCDGTAHLECTCDGPARADERYAQVDDIAFAKPFDDVEGRFGGREYQAEPRQRGVDEQRESGGAAEGREESPGDTEPHAPPAILNRGSTSCSPGPIIL